MSNQLTSYRVFIASPGGLAPERTAFRNLIAEFNESDAIHKNAHFVAVGWEETLGGVGRPQSQIDDEVRTCDYFVLLLCDRWGTPPDNDPSAKFTSGTEEEYNIAWECCNDEAKAMRQIIAFFKAVEPDRLNDPGAQLQKVLDFKKKIEHEKTLFFDTFDVTSNFERRFRRYLAQWLRDHEDGDTDKAVGVPPVVPLPPPGPSESLTTAPEAPKKSTNPLVDEADRLANEGRLTEAETLFAKSVARGDDPDAFNRYGNFLTRVGRLAQAEALYERVLELSAADEAWQAMAYGNLGIVYQTRGDLDQAETMHKKALAIDKKLGRVKGMANQYGNLGLIYETRGDLDQAEAMLNKSLAISEKLGRLGGMSNAYGNLGLIYQTRGDLDQAEAMLNKSLAISEKLGRMEGMASNYAALGLVYQTRGELDQAEAMHKKSLAISEKLGRMEGMASDYGNLGLIYYIRGNLDQAEAMHKKSLAIEEKLGRLEGMAAQYGNMGLIYQARGDLDQAEAMLNKSLAINEKLGRLGGVAADYDNLGSVYKQRGDLTKAREYWTKSRDLYQKIGMQRELKQVQGWLDSLPPAAAADTSPAP